MIYKTIQNKICYFIKPESRFKKQKQVIRNIKSHNFDYLNISANLNYATLFIIMYNIILIDQIIIIQNNNWQNMFKPYFTYNNEYWKGPITS